jgi:hypothetical protein
MLSGELAIVEKQISAAGEKSGNIGTNALALAR